MKIHKKIANICGYELTRLKTKQPTVESHLSVLFEKMAINCVIDVGANIGQYGKMLRKIGYNGHIISFEPISSCYEQLVKTSSEDKLWTVYNYALGSEEEEKLINITQASHFSSFHSPNDYSKEKFSDETIIEKTENVQIKKLDSVFYKITTGIECPRIFLKIDTQGFDIEVFRGADNSLKYILGLQSEISLIQIYNGMPTFIDSLQEFTLKNFQITGLYPVSREKNSLKLIELDCIMRKNEK